MPFYNVTLRFQGSNVNAVTKKAREFFGEDAEVSVQRVMNPVSRSERLDAASSEVSSAISAVEELKDELQNWLDNLPENMQSYSKADELQEAIDSLDEIQTDLENVNWDVNFPGMMG